MLYRYHKKVPEYCSGLRPEKELPERRSVTKIPLAMTNCTLLKSCFEDCCKEQFEKNISEKQSSLWAVSVNWL